MAIVVSFNSHEFIAVCLSLTLSLSLSFMSPFFPRQSDSTEKRMTKMEEPALQVVLTKEEFDQDLERLGRANGNIFHRRPGIEGVHDGQVMVRLKKKRFIIIDYSIVPNDNDIAAAAATPNISCLTGAGKQKCATPECVKIGVPVLLYDSDPAEPSSLYLRSGLCFTCQRNLNEKRRTQRKRTSDGVGTSVLYAIGPGQKKVKLNGATVELKSDAIILNGFEGTKSVRDGYGFPEIGVDLSDTCTKATADTERLINAVSSNTTATTTAATDTAADIEEAANVAVEASTSLLNAETTSVPPSSEDISALYDKAFDSLSKSIYLLSQWKQSWDIAIAAAVAQEAVTDPSLADAVASAAAVAAAAEPRDMVGLLLAGAEQQKGGNAVKPESEDVEAFEV